MKGELIRRGVVFFVAILFHRHNLCLVGLCEPLSQHHQLAVSNNASLIFTVALVLALIDGDLWPRRWPFRPFPANLICAAEVSASCPRDGGFNTN